MAWVALSRKIRGGNGIINQPARADLVIHDPGRDDDDSIEDFIQRLPVGYGAVDVG
jgi:hypothetical protein